jgi:hypothetical protein
LHIFIGRIMSLPLPPAETENGQLTGGTRDRRKPAVIDKVR